MANLTNSNMITVKIPYSFLNRLRVPISWPDIQHGLEHGLIGHREAIQFAIDRVATDQYSDDELAVAISSESESIADVVRRLAQSSGTESDDVLKKWARILVAWISESVEFVNDPLSLIEEVYCNYGHPTDLAPFVRYMPSDSPDLGSIQLNELRMLEQLGRFANDIVRPATDNNERAGNGGEKSGQA